ncbi:MAG TPA: hypothetical protein VJR29_13580 [bacterium]|nr:hypothetical protein [bacterium]
MAFGATAETPVGFSPSRQLAELLDQLEPEMGFRARAAGGAKVADLVEGLPPALSQQLRGRFGNAILAELVSLEKEREPELFFAGLLRLAGRLAQEPTTELTALGIYHRIEVASGLQPLISQARKQRKALQGEGSFGQNAEVFLRHAGREVGDYRNLLGTFAGATMASGFYKFAKYSTGRSMAQGLMARGIGPGTFEGAMMRMKAKAIGLAAGSFGAALSDRAVRSAFGQRVAWDASSLARDTAMYGVNLSAWRLASNLSTSYSVRAMMVESQPRNALWKELEIFTFRQLLGATSLGVAMVANQKIFDAGPENRFQALAHLASLSAGMNIGGLVGAKVLHLTH